MDLGDTDDTNVLIHSKFWKARRGSSQTGSRLKPLATSTSAPEPNKSDCKQQPTSGFMTSSIHLPRIEQGQRIDHPFHSRSPRRALTSSPQIQQQHDLGSAGNPLLGSILAGSSSSTGSSHFQSEVFRFDSTDRERYLCSAISEEEEVFSPVPYESPQIFLDSPSIRISGLHLKDDPPTPTSPTHMENQNQLMSRIHTGIAMLPTPDQPQSLFGIPSSPISPLTPNTPLSPSPLFSEQMFQQGFLAELYRRRCHSDSDLPLTPESCRNEPTDLSMRSTKTKSRSRPRKPIPHPLTIPTKGGSLESDQSSPQDSPLDLSVRGNLDRFGSSTSCESLSSRFLSGLAAPNSSTAFPSGPGTIMKRGETISPSSRNSVALRYNLDVSPVVEQMQTGSDPSFVFVCPICGQSFSLHDRLAKHMASRHKSKPHDPSKSYPCDVCHRSFARSDMLTRHMRLHTGVKPYTCRVCGQVFSRSDHLSTHQRTHTGEKPYKCPQCPYSACRRDMITRHLRTHSRNSSSSSSELQTPTSSSFSTFDSQSVPSSMELEDVPIKMESLQPSRPPSSSSSLAPDSPIPLSPNLNLNTLSVNSPSSPAHLHKE